MTISFFNLFVLVNLYTFHYFFIVPFQVTLSEIFRDSIISIGYATETSLTMMYTKKKLDVEDAVVIKPMDIKTIVVNVH
jgi:hypothetical protein